MNLKADQDFFEKFRTNVEEKVLSELNSKMDKIENKRVQNQIRKKIDVLEDRLMKGVNVNSGGFGSMEGGPLITKNNNTCISCN